MTDDNLGLLSANQPPDTDAPPAGEAAEQALINITTLAFRDGGMISVDLRLSPRRRLQRLLLTPAGNGRRAPIELDRIQTEAMTSALAAATEFWDAEEWKEEGK